MLDKIKHLVKHSAVYGISNAAAKAAGIILLPLYSSHFSIETYGRLGLLLITITILSQTLGMGQGQAVLRFSNVREFRNKRNSVLFSALILILLILILFLVFSIPLLGKASEFFNDPASYKYYLQISLPIVFFMVINNIFLNRARANEQSIKYSAAGIAKLLSLIAVTAYLLVIKNFGIDGVLFGYLAGEITVTIIFIPQIIKETDLKFDFSLIWKLFKFGFPLMFGVLAMNLLNGSDRYVLKELSTADQLGLYDLGYRFSGIINMFVIMPFTLTMLPAAYNMFGTEGDKRYYTKINTYLAVVLVWTALALTIFAGEIVRIFALNSSYYPAADVVPLLSISQVILGLSIMGALGMYLTGNTKYVALFTIISAAANIGLNILWVPDYGMMGAASASVIAFVFLFLSQYFAARRYYKIPFEYFKVIRIAITGAAIFFIVRYLNFLPEVILFFIKIALLLLFPFFLFFLGIFEKHEISALRGAINKWKNINNFSENIKKEVDTFKEKK